jgi:hypothetical protein
MGTTVGMQLPIIRVRGSVPPALMADVNVVLGKSLDRENIQAKDMATGF